MDIKYFAIKGETSQPTNFIIAPSDAVNKERADLVLTGVPADDLLAITTAITTLHTARASTDVAIRIDFLGGNIDVGTKTDGSAIIIPLGYNNIHLYGNGVKITGNVYDVNGENRLSIVDVKADNVTIENFVLLNGGGDGGGIANNGANCTITGNTCSSGDYNDGLYNFGNNCTITGNTCSSGEGTGLTNYGTNCTITGNICSSGGYGTGADLSNYGTNCTISGNTCSGAGLYNYIANCTITGNTCSSYDYGLSNYGTNCTITGNICSSGDYGLSNYGNNCTISVNTCSGGYGYGLSNTGTNCTITGNICSSDECGLYCEVSDTTNKCIITGNICITGGISVKTGTCLPATDTNTLRDPNDETKGYITVMEDVNTGVVTLRP